MKKKPPVQERTERSFIHEQSIKAIRIVQSECRLNMRGGSLPPTSNISVGVRVGGNSEEQTILANVVCEVLSYYEDDASNPALKIQCDYQIVYEFPNGGFPSVDDVELRLQELQMTAMIQLFPFVRHHVYWVSSQMQIPPITIPSYNFLADSPSPIQEEKVQTPRLKKKTKQTRHS